jgi:predicted transcriptional regulator
MEACETRLKTLAEKLSYRTKIWKREIELNSRTVEISSKRRDKLCIIAEILEIAKEGTLKTQIMYKANLSFAQLNDYLRFMLKIKLIQKLSSKGKEVYITTAKGLDFLQRQCELSELLKVEEEKPRNGAKIPPSNLFRKT